MNQETKKCQNCQKEFTIESEDFEFYEKIKVPAPTWCPECRIQRRQSFLATRVLYKRIDDFTGKEILSMFSPSYNGKVYAHDIWWSDKWDPMDYSREYNFSESFFEQFQVLLKEVPFPAKSIKSPVSDYSNHAAGLKDCYLVFNAGYCENCSYSYRILKSKDCFDLSHCEDLELCYECFKCRNCFRVMYSSNCEGCHDTSFSRDCIGCSHCFGCVNLRNKKYYIFNKPYSKEEYFAKLKNLDTSSFQAICRLIEKASSLFIKYPVKFMHGRKNLDVLGDYIYNSKRTISSFDIENADNLHHCQEIHYNPSAKDCYDYSSWGENAALIYECASCGGGVHGLKFCHDVFQTCDSCEYCIFCHNSSHLFGCIGLRHKQYCILNKQYSKEEYEELVPKIIEHMNKMPHIDKQGRVYKYGEFFPPELSASGYNETIAQEYFPLTKEKALAQGYSWYDRPKPEHKPTIKAKDLPDHIKDVDDSIINEIIECANASSTEHSQCTTAFKIIPQELEFYRKENLPLPRLCPNCRHYQRIKQRNPLKLWQRQCQCAGAKSSNGVYTNTAKHAHGDKPCPNEFQTTYAPDRKEIVYCEKCYLDEVV